MGLFRTAARASVAANVVGNTQRRQQKRWAAEDAAAQSAQAAQQTPPNPVEAPAAPSPQNTVLSMDEKIAQLQKLGQLRDSGILTDAEFEAEKHKVLGTA